jgi:hypothetical protein
MFRPIWSSPDVLKLYIINEETAMLPYRCYYGPLYAHVCLKWWVVLPM